MATPTDNPIMEASDNDVSNSTMEIKSFPGGVVSNKFKVTRVFGRNVENTKVSIDTLYLRQIFGGAGANQLEVIQREGLGRTGVNNWGIFDGLGSKAKLVANTYGMHTLAGSKWNNWFTLVFEVERFKDSTLQIMGTNDVRVDDNDENEASEWAIIGGTGEFRMAHGNINRKIYRETNSGIIQELTMEFFCRMKVPVPRKSGPWGGDGEGSLWEMEGKSQRLETVIIYHDGGVHGIQFSYVDEDGQSRTSGIWGRRLNDSHKTEIKFGPSEFVKNINGAARYESPAGYKGYLSKFEIVTNDKTYGPFGRDDGKKFTYTVPEGETVVGFFATLVDRTDNIGIRKIGVYTI